MNDSANGKPDSHAASEYIEISVKRSAMRLADILMVSHDVFVRAAIDGLNVSIAKEARKANGPFSGLDADEHKKPDDLAVH